MDIQFTVIIPTHNRIHELRTAIQSVIHQTNQNYECYVIADNPDEYEAVRSIVSALNDNRFHYLSNPQGGANASRNMGVELAKGEYLAFLDDDDEWEPQKLELHWKCHKDNNADMAFAYVKHVFHTKPEYVSLDCVEHEVTHDSLSKLTFSPNSSNVTIRTDIVKELKWDEALKGYQDWDLWFRASEKPIKIVQIQEILCIIHHSDSARISRGFEKRYNQLIDIKNKYGSTLTEIDIRNNAARELYYHISSISTFEKIRSLRYLNRKYHTHFDLNLSLQFIRNFILPSSTRRAVKQLLIRIKDCMHYSSAKPHNNC